MLSALYAAYVAVLAFARPRVAPALPAEERAIPGRELARRVAFVLVPPLLLILLVLGSIFAGVATPTEAGALGAVGAIGLARANRRLDLAAVRDTAADTSRLTCMVMMLLVGSTAFALVFRGVGGDLWIEHLLTNLPGGRVGLLVVANLAFFVLGCFLDFFEICFIILPLLIPAARAFDIDLVWFGVMLGVNLQTSFLTPPFGFALFYLRGVAPPSLTTPMIYRGVVPFIAIQIVALVTVIRCPELVMALLR
jgi:tripartite ATP-independent transporter DctM subunit